MAVAAMNRSAGSLCSSLSWTASIAMSPVNGTSRMPARIIKTRVSLGSSSERRRAFAISRAISQKLTALIISCPASSAATAKLRAFFPSVASFRSIQMATGCRLRSLECFPLDVDRRDDIPGDEQAVLQKAQRFRPRCSMRDQLRNRLAILRDHHGLAGALDLIHDGKALGLELGRLDDPRHGTLLIYNHGHHHGHIAHERRMRHLAYRNRLANKCVGDAASAFTSSGHSV